MPFQVPKTNREMSRNNLKRPEPFPWEIQNPKQLAKGMMYKFQLDKKVLTVG